MTDLKFLLKQKQWALDWLAKPDSEYPGTLTREKVGEVLDETEDALLAHTGIQLGDDGNFHPCYVE